jgi:hypothetical protein
VEISEQNVYLGMHLGLKPVEKQTRQVDLEKLNFSSVSTKLQPPAQGAPDLGWQEGSKNLKIIVLRTEKGILPKMVTSSF